MRIAELAGRRVAVWGYGREGKAALAALRARLPMQAVTLFCSEAEAQTVASDADADVSRGDDYRRDDGGPSPAHASPQALDALEALVVADVFADSGPPGPTLMPDRSAAANRARVGAPPHIVTTPPDAAALSAFDVVIKSPGISAYRPEIVAARHNGTRFTSGTALWFAEHPDARVIAVTGTKGKSTVTALVAHLLRSRGSRVALAGNIGLPLLELLDPPQTPAWWVIELSSFQTREAAHVTVGVINNVYEEHLDWHGTRERYVEDKLALAAVCASLVVNAGQASLAARFAGHPRVSAFGTPDGWHVADGWIANGSQSVFDLRHSPLRGPHNALNLCAALAALDAAGEDALASAPAIATFRPLPHRLHVLGDRDGCTWIDDSIATTPLATLEALATIDAMRAVVLVGGHDRGLDWQPFAEAVRRAPPRAVVTMGANGARIHALLASCGGAYRLIAATDLVSAVAAARADAGRGDTILLSPGAPSFDQFRDYAERGRAFARLGGFDPDAIGAIEGLGVR